MNERNKKKENESSWKNVHGKIGSCTRLNIECRKINRKFNKRKMCSCVEAVRGTMMTREKITWTGNESYILTGPLHSLIFTLVIPSLHTYTHPKMYKLTSNRALNNNVYIYFAYACHTHTHTPERKLYRSKNPSFSSIHLIFSAKKLKQKKI